tara:strand:+ start:121 stop:474 length:354 start_codon:yes stop_codon:yes gene_type:complete
MSYDIWLAFEDGNTCTSSIRIQEGGTQVMGGTKECHLNITYNYSSFFYEVFPQELGLRWLHAKTGRESIPILEKAVERLGTRRDDDYWKATMGNAGHALNILLVWAREHPNGIWWGD